MSYSFDGSGDHLYGDFAATYAKPVTIAVWVKYTDHPLANDNFIQLGNLTASTNDSVIIRSTTTDNEIAAASVSTTGNTDNADVVKAGVDDTWVAAVGVFVSDDERYIYFSDQSEANSLTRTVGDTLQFVALGETRSGIHDFTGLLAEAAIWNKQLSADEISKYQAGIVASSIAPANLIGYWPLSASNATQSNLGLDAGGDLAVTNATFSSDHPAISSGGTTITPNVAGMSV